MEVGWYLETSAEAVPLFPGCGVLVDLGIVDSFGDKCVRSIVHSHRLTVHKRRHSLQGEGWGDVDQKCSSKLWMVRWMILEAASSSFLSIPVIRSTDA